MSVQWNNKLEWNEFPPFDDKLQSEFCGTCKWGIHAEDRAALKRRNKRECGIN